MQPLTEHFMSTLLLLQMQTAATIIGPSTTVAGANCFSLTVIVTYPASAVQLPFSDPAAAALGSVPLAVSGPQTFAVNSSVITVRPNSFSWRTPHLLKHGCPDDLIVSSLSQPKDGDPHCATHLLHAV